MRGVGPGACIFEPSKGPLPFDLGGDALDPKRNGPLRLDIMFSYPTRSGVNVLEDFNLEVKVDDKVAIVHIISEISQSKLLIIVLARTWEGVEAECAFLTFEIRRSCSRQNHVRRMFIKKNSSFKHVCIDIREFTSESWRSVIGVVPQERGKYPPSYVHFR